MGYKELLDAHVRRKLEDNFGKGMALMIMASATNAAKVPVMDLTRDDYVRLVDALCADQRLVDMWGSAGAQDARRQWTELQP